jgi:hypothetical protein
VRTRSINREDADLFLLQFRRDVATGRLEVFSIGELEFAMAELLVERYAFGSGLRALDALQLPVALELRNQKLVGHFCRGRCDTLWGCPTGGVLGNQP